MEREVVRLQKLEDETIIKKSQAIRDEILLSFPGCTLTQICAISDHIYGWNIITPNTNFVFWINPSTVAVSWHPINDFHKDTTRLWKYDEIDFQSFFNKHKFNKII